MNLKKALTKHVTNTSLGADELSILEKHFVKIDVPHAVKPLLYSV